MIVEYAVGLQRVSERVRAGDHFRLYWLITPAVRSGFARPVENCKPACRWKEIGLESIRVRFPGSGAFQVTLKWRVDEYFKGLKVSRRDAPL